MKGRMKFEENMNAQKELIAHIKDRKVEFIKIAFFKSTMEEPMRIEGAIDVVLPKLNFEYNNGYGWQKLFGYIWYADGTWSDRGENNGAEYWQHQYCPDREVMVDV